MRGFCALVDRDRFRPRGGQFKRKGLAGFVIAPPDRRSRFGLDLFHEAKPRGRRNIWTVFYGRINAAMMSGDHRSARAGVEAFLAEAEAAGLPGHAAFARRMRGFLRFLAGELAAARMDLEQALEDYDETRDERLRTAFAIDFRSNALTFPGQVAWWLGEPEEAKRFTNEAIGRAKDSGQPASYVAARYNRLLIGALCGAAAEVLPAAEEMRAYADQHDLRFWRAMASTYADWARVRLGEPRAEAFHAGLGAYAELGARMQEAALLPLLADVELVAGRRDEALAAAERGLALAAETGLGAWRPWLMRKRGDALGETDVAGAATVAGAQGARALALQAALALAKLYRPAAPPTPTPSSRPRSKAWRRRPRCPKSPRRRRWWSIWRRAALGGLRAYRGRRGRPGIRPSRCSASALP